MLIYSIKELKKYGDDVAHVHVDKALLLQYFADDEFALEAFQCFDGVLSFCSSGTAESPSPRLEARPDGH